VGGVGGGGGAKVITRPSADYFGLNMAGDFLAEASVLVSAER
jgi:hypothetical protein